MKRGDLINHLSIHGCHQLREGSKHSVYVNLKLRKSSTIPRHSEINDFLVKKICKDLEIPQT
jgi:predicted RNA binding protein YcfA (HicA-like mRNA interferase family)